MNNRIHLSSFVKIGEDYHLVWLNLNFNHGASCKSVFLSTRSMINHLNKAVYTAISVACGWAGAVMSLCKPRNSEIRDRKLDDTDRPIDGYANQ